MSPRRAGPMRAVAAGVLLAALGIPAASAPARPADPPAAPGPARLPAPVVGTLENGLQVAVFPVRRLPIVQIQLLIPAGSVDAAEGTAGLASLTATALRQGTPSRDALEIARAGEALGSTISSVTGRDYTLLSGGFLASDLRPGLELVSDLVLRPIFPQEGVDRLRREAMGNLLQSLGDAAATADQEVWSAAFSGHPYGPRPDGALETVAGLGVPQVRSFYRDRYRPDRSLLAVAGDVEPEKVFAAAEEAFGTWSGRATPDAPAPGTSPPGIRVRIVDRPELERCEIRIGEVGPARSSSDDLPLALANRVLGGSPQSRLAGLGAAAGNPSSTFTPLRGAGLLTIAATVRVDSAGAAVRSILGELDRFHRQPPSDGELAEARRHFVRVFPLSSETLAGLTAQWLASRFCGLPDDFSTDYDRHIAAVTPGAVTAAVQRWIVPDRAVVVALGPAERLRLQFEPIGTVEVMTAGGSVAGSPAATPEQRQRGRELVAQALEAHGGRARIEAIQRSNVVSDVRLGMGAGAVRGTMTLIRAEPGRRLVLLTEIQGMRSRQVLEGDRAWVEVAADSTSPRPADSSTVATLREVFVSDVPHLLLGAARADADVSWRGRDRVGDRDVDRVELVLPGAPRRRLLLDAETHRLLALDEPGRSGFGFGARRTYTDYREVDRVWWPYNEERTVDGQRVILFEVRSVALNGQLPEDLFRIESPAQAR